MLVTALFVTTGVLYSASCVLYLILLGKGGEPIGKWATRILLVAGLSHLAYLGFDMAASGRLPMDNIYQTLSSASLIIVVAYLIASRNYRIAVLGAFITPVTLLFLMGAGLGRTVGPVPAEVRSALVPVHIGANVLGIAAFALAFAVALAYMIQERQLRQKKLSGLFHRLPALDVLDSLGLRFVTIGFPLLTLGIITGTAWAFQIDSNAPAISAAQGFAVLEWLVFASVLLLRVAVGWQGRRAAIGTIIGFACGTAVLLGYLLKATGSSA